MIKEFMIGNTHIKINDKYCHNQTEEERQEIMQRISNMAYAALVRQEQTGSTPARSDRESHAPEDISTLHIVAARETGRGSVAQTEEHPAHNQEVAGSIPAGSSHA